jgi:hypothetical protein
VGDALLWLFLMWGIAEWPDEHRQIAIFCLLGWMIFSKFIKLITHFVRYPIDVFLWPVSILFGWLHGIIKMYALATLSEVRFFLLSFSDFRTDSRRPHGEAVQVQTPMIQPG